MPMRALKWKRSQNYMKDFLWNSFFRYSKSASIKIYVLRYSKSQALVWKSLLGEFGYFLGCKDYLRKSILSDPSHCHQVFPGLYFPSRYEWPSSATERHLRPTPRPSTCHHSLGFGKERPTLEPCRYCGLASYSKKHLGQCRLPENPHPR